MTVAGGSINSKPVSILLAPIVSFLYGGPNPDVSQQLPIEERVISGLRAALTHVREGILNLHGELVYSPTGLRAEPGSKKSGMRSAS